MESTHKWIREKGMFPYFWKFSLLLAHRRPLEPSANEHRDYPQSRAS